MIIKAKIRQIIEHALKEDIGAGDITTASVIPRKQRGRFIIISNEPCVVCGMSFAEACFFILDKDIHFRPMANDGASIPKGKVIAHIEGSCQPILMAERTALNFLGWLSGISTLTYKFVDAIKEYKAQVLDTRKTIPTLRFLQRYAVKIGGGKNHRMGLYDQVLIKDNHLTETRNQQPKEVPSEAEGKSETRGKESYIRTAIERARKNALKNKIIEIEVKNLKEFKEALLANPEIIMLDNMKIQDIKEAVKLRDAHRLKQQDIGFKTLLEVSGNVDLDNVKEIASASVDMISIGALTHSAPSIDFSMKAE